MGQCSYEQFPGIEFEFDFDATSGPLLGENPTGSGFEELFFSGTASYVVTCLQVTRNTAAIGGVITDTGRGIGFVVVDNGPSGLDLRSRAAFDPDPPTPTTPDCGAGADGAIRPILPVDGDIVVIDNVGAGGDDEDDDDDGDDGDDDDDGDRDGDDGDDDDGDDDD